MQVIKNAFPIKSIIFRINQGINMVIQEVTQIIAPVVEEMGLEFVDIEYLSEHGRWVLRLFLDKEGGITLDDCAKASREIGDLIDVKGVIGHEYVLEVSSPGLDRRLKKDKDFLRAIGKKIRIKMAVPLDGHRNFTGYLRDFKDGVIDLETATTPVSLSIKDIERANL
ncbi:MAG TPA: ribosome maturation factor RimP, partial [Desulfobacteraceae bacterium]|nr:ribosome maturation factor RimP [Desulfobacteraceae bacterium]